MRHCKRVLTRSQSQLWLEQSTGSTATLQEIIKAMLIIFRCSFNCCCVSWDRRQSSIQLFISPTEVSYCAHFVICFYVWWNGRCVTVSHCSINRRCKWNGVLTFAFDTSSLLPLSCSHICLEVLLPCGSPEWSNRPIMVNVTLKTCSTRGLAHFSSSSLSSNTVNSSTVAGSSCCLGADAGSLLVGCSGRVSSVIRLMPRRGRVVDIPLLGHTTPPNNVSSVFSAFGGVWNLLCLHGLFPL